MKYQWLSTSSSAPELSIMTSPHIPAKRYVSGFLHCFNVVSLFLTSSSTAFGRKEEARLHFFVIAIFGRLDATNIVTVSPNNSNDVP